MAIAWVPWLLLALERFLDRPSLLRAALLLPLGLGFAMSSMNMFVFTGVTMLVWLAVAAAQDRVGLGHVARLAAVGAAGAALLWAYVAPYRTAARDWGLERTLSEVERGAADAGPRRAAAAGVAPALGRVGERGWGPSGRGLSARVHAGRSRRPRVS